MNPFEQFLIDLTTVVDPNKAGHELLQQALSQGRYTINPQMIANKWLKQSFYLCSEDCLQD